MAYSGSVELEAILGITPLTEVLRATTSGIPDPFPPEFAMVKPANRVLGDRAKWIRIYGARTTAKLGVYGTEGRRVPLQPIATQPVRCFYVPLQFQIDMLMLAKLQSFTKYEQDEGVEWVGYQLQELAKRIGNTRIVAKASMLANATVYWDGDGNILPSSSGAVYSLPISVPASNLNQLNGIITQSWAITNTDILSNIRYLHRQSKQDTGLKISTALYGINIPTYFQVNTTLSGYLARNPGWRDTLVDTGDVPRNFGGIDRWVNVSDAFFEDQNGTNQLLWGNDAITFCPSINTPDKMDWWATFEGSIAVPKSFDVQQTPEAALKNFRWEYGQSSFAVPNVWGVTPGAQMGVTVYVQDVHLPAIRNEKGVYMATVVF